MSPRGWALVTGARQRLGRALALAAAEAGYDVVVHAREAAEAEETASEVGRLGRVARAAGGDLSDPATCHALVAAAPEPLRLLVNSASLFEHDEAGTLTPAGLEGSISVNLRAPLLLSQAFVARLGPEDEGLVVNVIDQKVLRLDPRFFSYTVAKSALWAATRMMAQAFAPRVRVNAIGPGPTLRSIHQTEESFAAEAAGSLLGQPVGVDQIQLALRYLIDARAVTGQMIAVDAGQHLGWRTPDVIEP
ncbi:MAG: SDR family oxidoreductase [Caulobacteraceae bacterium]|nr:SDR family oxidoreductase [Caulobacteraceae bacterium]